MTTEQPHTAMRWQLLALLSIVAVVAIVIGAAFAPALRSGVARAGQLAGFRHSHEEDGVATTNESGQVQYYTCGMHPWVILPAPGDCPICHMALTPIDPNKFTGEITIDPVVVQNMGVRIAPVVTGPLTRTIRTVGTIDYNERAVRDVNIKVSGWIEELHIDFVGAKVAAGDPLFELYSPQLYAAQEEYLLALNSPLQRGAGATSDAEQGAADLLQAARTRLEYFDITDEQISQLERQGEPSKTMTIRSPHTGVVIAKHANEGMEVDSGMQVFRIADLSKVWVLVTLYEYQLPYVEEGMSATMTLPYIPGQMFEGEVLYIYPYLEKKSRELQVRLEFANPGNLLKPGMFASVELQNTLALEKTLAPRSAIIDTGERQVAFVSHGEGKFEPRDVRLGVETGDGMVEIISGLKPGEIVVTSGQFLIDSESKIREALAKMIKGDLASEQEVTAELAGASALTQLTEPVAATLNTTLQHYLAIGDILAGDEVEGLAAHARVLASSLDQIVQMEVPEDPHFWHTHQDAVATARAGAFKLIDADDLAEARLQFAEVSASLETLYMATGVPPSLDQEVQVLHCPMYREGQGGTIWLQAAGDVRNPYYGSAMLECFDQRKALPVTGGGQPPEEAESHEVIEAEPMSQMAARSQLATASQEQLDEIVVNYLAVQQMLTEDQWEDAVDELEVIRQQAEQLTGDATDSLAALAERVAEAAAVNAEDIEQFREGFYELSKALLSLTQSFPPSQDAVAGLYHAYCPMVKRDWLQATDQVRNPYDPSMLGCGTIRGAIELNASTSMQDQETE